MLTLFVAGSSLVAFVLATTNRFNLELTWTTGAPDGFERQMIHINGQFPGPLLEIQQGQWVEMVVKNGMPFNTTIHSHGIEQLNTPWADGTPGLSQRHILPGETFTYKWYAHQYGSYFYHAHSNAQIDDGCYGPMIIKPQQGIAKPFDLIPGADTGCLEKAEADIIPVVLSDWRHKTSQETLDIQSASGVESSICVDAILVNGKGAVDCWPREDLTKFTPANVAPLLEQFGLEMSDKGCVPAELYAIVSPSPTTIDTLPPEVMSLCTPTQGSREVISAPKDAEWMALDIIQTASVDTFAFSIDEHPMWIFAVDGHYIEPLQVDAINIGNGDRYSVFVQLDKPAKNYGIRAASIIAAQLIDTTAVLSYSGNHGHYKRSVVSRQPNTTSPVQTGNLTSTPSINRNGSPASNSTVFFDQAKMISFPPAFPQPAPAADQMFKLVLQNTDNKTYTWAINGTAYDRTIDDSVPPLLYQRRSESGPRDQIIMSTKNNTWVDLIFLVGNDFLPQPPHPIHKHSNKGFIIGSGFGAFNYSSVAEAYATMPQNFNLVNPPYRDGFVTPAADVQPTWLAVRYPVVNPGAWLLHCHIQSHLSGGMAMVILDGVDEWPEAPEYYKN